MTVSYLITLYNKQDFIANVIDAVLAEQAVTGGEVIVYDDVSTDKSLDIARERLAAKSIVHIEQGDINRGVGFATNYLIKAAAQPYTRLIDADDVVVRGSTAHMLRHLKANNLGFIHGMTTEVGNNDIGLENQPFAHCYVIQDPVRTILRHTIAGTSPSLFVTGVLRRVAPVPEWVRRTQDFLITLRVANSGTPMGYVPDTVSVGPSDRTGNNLSASLAAMFAEMSRDVAHDGKDLPIEALRYAARRYAGRTAKYFRRRGQNKLSKGEKLGLWWQGLPLPVSRKTCIDRLNGTADLLERDRHVLVTGPSGRP